MTGGTKHGIKKSEISEPAVRWAQANATVNKINNVRFVIGKAEAIFKGLKFPAAETALVIDPPRKGCDASFLEQLIQFGPQRLIYVSCDPATQARDLKVLIQAGYAITRILWSAF